MRRLTRIGSGLWAVLGLACSGGEPSPSPTPAPTEAPTEVGVTPTAQPPTPTPPPPTSPPVEDTPPPDFFGFDFSGVRNSYDRFSMVVDGAVQLGQVDEVFDLSARLTGGEVRGRVDYAWSFPNGQAHVDVVSQEEEALSVRFTEEGGYLVRVTATDAGGDSTVAGAFIRVVRFDPDQPFLVGDLNDDGAVDGDDVAALRGQLTGALSLGEEALQEADLDRDTRVGEADLELLEQAVDAGDASPTWLSAHHGSAGTPIHVLHPELLDLVRVRSVSVVAGGALDLDPTCESQMVEVASADEVTWSRGGPGRLSFQLPLRLACLREDAAMEIRVVGLHVGGGEEEITLGEIEARPLLPASEAPGESVLELWARVRAGLEAAAPLVTQWAELAGASEEQRVAVAAVAEEMVLRHAEAHGHAHVAFLDMDEATRGAFEQMMRGAGSDELLRRAEELTRRLGVLQRAPEDLSPEQGEAALELICSLQDLADLSVQVASLSFNVADKLGVEEHFPVGRLEATGPIVNFLSQIEVTVFVSIDLAELLADLVPVLGEELTAEAEPSALKIGEATALSASLPVELEGDVCSSDPFSITVQLQAVVDVTLEGRTSGNNQVARTRDGLEELLADIEAAIEERVAEEIPASLDVDVPLDELLGELCAAFASGEIPLEVDFLTPSCGALAGASWTCVEECVGLVTFAGEKDVCGQALPAETSVTCEREDEPPPLQPPPLPPQPPAQPIPREGPVPGPGSTPLQLIGGSILSSSGSVPQGCPDDFHTLCGPPGHLADVYVDFDPSTTALDVLLLSMSGVQDYYEITGFVVETQSETFASALLTVQIASGTPSGETTLSLQGASSQDGALDPETLSAPLEFPVVVQ